MWYRRILTVNTLSVLLLLAIEHCVFVSWQHFGLGGHLGLPALDQLDSSHLPSLVGGQGGSAHGQATTENIPSLWASTMSTVGEGSVDLCVHQALALSGLGELLCSSRGGTNSSCGSCGGLCCNLSLESTIKDRDNVVDAAKATSLAQLLRC
jgi:hypothetical protein